MSDPFRPNPFRLAFGLMRLPKNPDGTIDIPQVSEMADRFIAAGGTYFDTAYVYDGGASEKAFKAAVADRFPRDTYTLATKLNAVLGAKDEKSAKEEFSISLERTGAGYFDYYLLHAMQLATYRKYDEYGLWDYVKGLKEKGLIRHWGFSFHATPDLLEKLLDAHPDAEFVQLQINYADWENPGVASRRNWEICRERGKPVMIMEPVKGGILADPIPAVREIFDASGENVSYASWALRFAAGLEGVHAVLSGMSSIAQMEDNLKTMKDFRPLDEREMELIRWPRRPWTRTNPSPARPATTAPKAAPWRSRSLRSSMSSTAARAVRSSGLSGNTTSSPTAAVPRETALPAGSANAPVPRG